MVKVGSGSGVKKRKSTGGKVQTGGTKKKSRPAALLGPKTLIKETISKSSGLGKAVRKLKKKHAWKQRKAKKAPTEPRLIENDDDEVEEPEAPPPVMRESTGTPEDIRKALR